MTNPNEPVFSGKYLDAGLTKREWFAGMFISGGGYSYEEAVKFADLIIAELSKVTK